jgi:spermidine/putrescine ABC transporter ATP-binding subunit
VESHRRCLTNGSKMAQVDIQGVAKRYGSFTAIEDATLTVPEGAFFSLLGPSGSGKTTLLRLVAGFVHPDEGTIRIGNKVMNGFAPHQREIGMVFQNYALFPHRTVAQNVAFGLEMRGIKGPEQKRRVGEALELVQLGGKADSYPRELSGGQQQRVAIARSIVIKPAVLLLDEPLSALDQNLRAEMQVELRALQKHLKITTIYVTHDQEEALALSDHIAILNAGRIAQLGNGRDLYERPQGAFVARFLGNANLLDATLERQGENWFVHSESCLLPVRHDDSYIAGAKVKLALRPERLRLARSASGKGSAAAELPALVVSMAYLGHDVRVVLRLNSDRIINARIPSDALDPQITESCKLFVTWKPEESIVVQY